MSTKRTGLSLLVCLVLSQTVCAQWSFTDKILENSSRVVESSKNMIGDTPPAMSFKPGEESDGVAWLTRRLLDEGYLGNDGTKHDIYGTTAVYDEVVVDAVKSFQKENGLNADGIAGPETMKKLVPVTEDAIIGGEVWSRHIAELISEHQAAGHKKLVVVNIPTFTLHAINLEDGTSETSRVIVGTPGTRTPLMTTNIVNLKANPDWSPPPSIRGARYTRPGINNPLGLMRFSTDNSMNIYLHDTNSRHLFDKSYRAMSHGCIRVKEWENLSMWLSGRDETWLNDEALGDGRTRFIKIDKTPVVITYSLYDISDDKINTGVDVYRLGNIIAN